MYVLVPNYKHYVIDGQIFKFILPVMSKLQYRIVIDSSNAEEMGATIAVFWSHCQRR